MIRFLKGTVFEHREKALILLVGGVGYQVTIPSRLQFEQGAESALFIHTHVREDALSLFGFTKREELDFFELLITVNGIGPKMAMEILNEPVENIQNAIFGGNLAALTKISGVGKKLAERLILELKGKVSPSGTNALHEATRVDSNLDEDAVSALETLGYKRSHIARVLSELPEQPIDTEAVIRYFLQKV